MQKEIRQKIVELIYRVEVQQQPTANGPRPNNNGGNSGNGGNGGGNSGTSAEIQQALAAPKIKGMAGQVRNVKATQASVESVTGGSGPAPIASREAPAEPVKADMWSKVGPNDLCPCGSGKKFKKCHYPILRDQKTTVVR
jgi:preprotein translocase subunit SecA